MSVLTVSLLGHVTAEPVRHRRTSPFGRHSAMGRLRCPMAPPDRVLVSAHLVRRGSIDPDEVLATLALGRRPDGSCWVRYGVDVVELDV
ncbi:MAG: hypothetical protein OES57_18535 [Acidimicrobiia bacterium]|nr:hypothetical protein [Acidimicrobiia bacterium]